jgi:hypothetical protein
MTNEDIDKYAICNGDLLKKLNFLKDELGQKNSNKGILDHIGNFMFLQNPLRRNILEEFVTELEKYSKNETFDLLLMLNFIAEIKNAEHKIKIAIKENKNRYKSQKTANENKNKILIALQPYLRKVDELCGPNKEYPCGCDKKSALETVWEEHMTEMKKVMKQLGKKITLGIFSSRFEDYLDLCREHLGSVTSAGRRLKKYNKQKPSK